MYYQPISVGTEDPEYYAEILCKTSRLNRRLTSDDQHCPDVQRVDDPLARRLQSLLDALANISLCQRGNVSATMACLKDNKGALETQLYIVFNHENDEAARRCPQHLQDIFNMLRQVPYKPPAMDGSPKVIPNELEPDFIEICRAIHNYAFDIFAYRVNKRKHNLLDIRGYIEQGREHLTDEQRETLLEFLMHVDAIIQEVNKPTTKQLPTDFIKILLRMYSYWTKHGLLPKDSLAHDKVTLLDNADAYLADKYRIGFQLRRWALKIMSFLISANRLFILTQSHRLRKLVQGKLSVKVLNSPTTVPYFCNLSSETVKVAWEAALAESSYLSAKWDKERESFVQWLLEELEDSEVIRWKPSVHAELAMIMAMVDGKTDDVLPYVGVSKLSCIMCSHYIQVFNDVMKQKIATRGSRGKAYPGWSWPSLPDRDGELRTAFLGRMRQQLLDDFEHHVKTSRLSDSGMGSGGPEWEIGTEDEIRELLKAGGL